MMLAPSRFTRARRPSNPEVAVPALKRLYTLVRGTPQSLSRRAGERGPTRRLGGLHDDLSGSSTFDAGDAIERCDTCRCGFTFSSALLLSQFAMVGGGHLNTLTRISRLLEHIQRKFIERDRQAKPGSPRASVEEDAERPTIFPAVRPCTLTLRTVDEHHVVSDRPAFTAMDRGCQASVRKCAAHRTMRRRCGRGPARSPRRRPAARQ